MRYEAPIVAVISTMVFAGESLTAYAGKIVQPLPCYLAWVKMAVASGSSNHLRLRSPGAITGCSRMKRT